MDERTVEEIFRTLLENNAEAVLLTRPDGTVLHANAAACAALGREPGQIATLGRTGLVVETPDLSALLLERQAGSRASGELVFRRPDGTTFPAEFSSTLIRLSSGDAVNLFVFRDVSSRRDLERRLRESEELFRTVFQLLPDAVSITDIDTGTFVLVNDGAAIVTGWNPGDMVGRTAEEIGLWHEGDRAAFVERIQRDGFVHEFPTRLGRKGGVVLDVLLSAKPVEIGGRRLLLTVTRDVTEVQALQSKLAVSSRLAAMGTLVAGVAHEINNPLTIALAASETAREIVERVTGSTRPAGPLPLEEARELGVAREALDDARGALERISLIIRDMASLSLPAPTLARTSLARIVREALHWLPGSVSRFQRIQLVDEGAPDVLVAPVQLQQVVVNLVANAAKSIPAGSAGGVVVRTGRGPSETAFLEVADEGSGMPPDVMERIFDPFYTTRRSTGGMGLGLPICHSIVTAHGGTIRVSSVEGKGSVFRVELPAAREQEVEA